MADQPEAPDLAAHEEPMDTSVSQVHAEADVMPTSNSASNENMEEKSKETEVNDNDTPGDNDGNEENTATKEDEKLGEANEEQQHEDENNSNSDQAFEEVSTNTKETSTSPVKIQLIKNESKTDADVPSKDEDFDSPKGEIKEESSESQDSSENIELKEIKLEIPKLEIKNESSSQDGKEAASHKYLKCASCCKNLEGSGNMLAWDMHVFCDDICLTKYQNVLKECFRCKNIINKTNLGKFTAHCDQSMKLFCSASCLEEKMNEESVRCLISNTPGQGFYEPLGDKGLVKFFARRECYDEFYQLKGKKAAKRPLINCEDCGEEKPLGCSLLFLGKKIPFCGESCLTNYKNEKGLQKSSKCDFCQLDFVSNFVKTSSFQFAVQVFCSSRCQYFYRIDQGSKPLYCAWCKALKPECSMICKVQSEQYFCSNHCSYMQKMAGQNGDLKKNVRNKGTMKRPNVSNKGVNVKPQPVHKTTQSEAPAQPTLVPVAAPVFMPVPMQMYQRPFPVPVPIPLPIPVPIFVPTTRNSTRGVKKFLKKMKAKLPANVFEAQILEMAGALDDKNDPLDSDDSAWEDYDDDETDGHHVRNNLPPQPKLPNEDVEHIIRAGNIVPKPLPHPTPDACPSPNPPFGGYNRGSTPAPRLVPGVKQEENSWQRNRPQINRNRNANRGRRQSRPVAAVETNPALAALTLPPKERPDAKHHLKFTYGVNAWRHWVVGKNAELEKQRAQGKYMKPFETDILKLRADELNYTLCMFVKEVRKPNGDPYASDSILYLTLGIQEYLFENGRIDNIFTDMYYEPFTSANHEVIKDFKLPINELGYFVTRIEEEHLWEAKQLGAHSPQVLLNTLIYFNAKYFMMKTLDDHTKLSFTHIMKHWKKGGTATPATKNPPVPGEKRTTLLRYYPPAHLKGNRHDDRKCFEQQELPDNPLRCPVKLYEFYLSHCPESAKTKSDMFYLQPERSCVPDSPVWYSAQPLNSFQLEKMLARILMVREVQEHMLADAAAHA